MRLTDERHRGRVAENAPPPTSRRSSKILRGYILGLPPHSPTVFKRARGVGVALAVVLLLFFSFQRKSIFAGFVSSFKYRRRTILKSIKNERQTNREEAASMGKARAASSSDSSRKMRPALTPEARENQMISLAVDLAEKQLMEGTASSQVITHYLKLGSTRERLEREKIERENELLRAKVESLQSAHRSEELYENALKAFRRYSGEEDLDEEDL